MNVRILLLLASLPGAGIISAQAQCPGFSTALFRHHRAAPARDSGVVPPPPGRGGAFAGLLALRDREGTTFLGGDFEASYFLTGRWRSGLRGTVTRPARTPALPAAPYDGVVRPQADVFGLTWSNALLLRDQPRWRLEALAGAGVGWRHLRDADQPGPARGPVGRCGCHSRGRVLDTAWNPVTEMGLTATYKPRAAGAPWWSVRGQYRAWYGDVPFGRPGQFSHYVLSLGVSLPDVPRRGR